MTETEAPGNPPDGYADALAELQQILEVLEAPDVDVDVLATHVDRAAELVRFCRERLVAAETQVTEIVAGLEDLDTGSGAASDDEPVDEEAGDGEQEDW